MGFSWQTGKRREFKISTSTALNWNLMSILLSIGMNSFSFYEKHTLKNCWIFRHQLFIKCTQMGAGKGTASVLCTEYPNFCDNFPHNCWKYLKILVYLFYANWIKSQNSCVIFLHKFEWSHKLFVYFFDTIFIEITKFRCTLFFSILINS